MTEEPAPEGFKHKAKHELQDFLLISLYLGFFFCALVTYTTLLLRKYEVSYLNYTFAIVNALIIAKVILLGDMAHLGRKAEARPLYQSVLVKSVLFGFLLLAFHFVEDFVKVLFHGEPVGTALHQTDFTLLTARTIIVFCALVPLFAFLEARRVMGEKELYKLFREHHD